MIQNELPATQEYLDSLFKKRRDHIFEQLEDGKSVNFFYLSKSKNTFYLENQKWRPEKFLLAFHSTDSEFQFHYDAKKDFFQATEGILQFLTRDEHVVIIDPNNRTFCSGYKTYNSNDFRLMLYAECNDICIFYINDGPSNFVLDILDDKRGGCNFESLFHYLYSLSFNVTESTNNSQEEFYNDELYPDEFL